MSKLSQETRQHLLSGRPIRSIDVRDLISEIEELESELAAKDAEIEQLKRELEVARRGYVNCTAAQREADGACLGFQISEQDDEPCEQCKYCPMYTGNESVLMGGTE